MAKKRSALVNRAWKLLRLALISARKGVLFKRGFVLNLRLRLLSNHVRSLCASDSNPYGEYEFSCDETPIFHYKLHKPYKHLRYLPRIPCINPPINLDDEDVGESYDGHDDIGYFDHEDDDGDDRLKPEISQEEEEIDSKAEEFIARFYEEMRLQKQVSYFQYTEMLHRGAS